MYKLLLVTDREDVRAAFAEIKDWELMGFRAPRMVMNAEEAAKSLARHHADGIAIEMTKEQFETMHTLIFDQYPQLPVMRAAADVKTIREDVEELSRLLNRTHADYSNDYFDEAEMMQQCRHEYFRKLIMGKLTDPEAVNRYLRLLRSRMDTGRKCVLIELGYPEDDGYMAMHWHYGADRLEVAMRNFFHAELMGMRILISVLPDERLYLLACPMVAMTAPEDPEELKEIVCSHAERSIRDVKEYLRIDLTIQSVDVLPGILSLAGSGS